jgi:hypothetical protein
MSVLVMDYDSNAPTPQHLWNTHYAFYKTVRDANPDLPIVMISHPSALHAVNYTLKVGPEWGSFADRRAAIHATYDRAVAAGDKNVYFIDGREIFAGDDWDACTVDGTHPNDFGFQRFAKYLEPLLRSILYANA